MWDETQVGILLYLSTKVLAARGARTRVEKMQICKRIANSQACFLNRNT